MKRRLGALLCLVVPSTVLALSTRSFVIDTSEAFEEGKLDGVASYAGGRLTGTLRTERSPVPGVSVATCSALGKDDAIYIGTGNQGAVYRVKGATSTLVAKTSAAAITSLVFAGDRLYAGSLPAGRIFAIEANGTVSDGVALEGADAVWGLAYDEGRRLLYAATGPEGRLFAIDSAGRAKLLYDDPAEHLLSVALDGPGRVLVGTSHGARLIRVTAGDSRVVHDFPGTELTAVSSHAGIIAAAVNDFPTPPAVPSDPHKNPAARLVRPKPGKGKLYAVQEGGRVDELYASETGHISAVEIEMSGRAVLAGLAEGGRIVRATLDGERALWSDVDERQVVSLGLSLRTPYFVTSDGVAVHRATAKAGPGQWTSAVLDAKFPARWGEMSARARGPVRLQTRSGDTETPDSTWSDWSAPNGVSGPVHSSPARFLQIRAQLERDAEVYAVTAYYLAENQAARVRNVRLQPNQPKLGAQPTATAKPADARRSASLALTWDLDNPDEDPLRFRLFYRREEQTTWLAMLPESETLEKAEHSWDTRAVPDARYRVRVVASDELVNPPPYVRRTEAISAPLLVDNHAPQITELTVSGRAVRGRVVDSLGPITRIEVAVDGDSYQPVFPDDDLFDTRDERFTFELGNLPRGLHLASARAADGAGHFNSRAVEFTVQR